MEGRDEGVGVVEGYVWHWCGVVISACLRKWWSSYLITLNFIPCGG